ncbi:outer membrane beta-barrel protein [Sulfurimonas sp.]
MNKQILFLLILLTSSLFADAKVYVGTGLTRVDETLDATKKAIPNSVVSLKIGYGQRDSYAIEFSTYYTQNKSKYFSKNDAQKMGFDVDLIKAYDFGIYVNPYVKVGFGAGAIKTDADTINQSLTYGNFNAALGFFIPLSSQMDLELAYQYKYLSYEKIDVTTSANPTSHSNGIYFGFNIRF